MTSPTDIFQTTDTPPVSVVICAHTMKRATLLCAAVESIAAQTVKTAEIIVVCDHNQELETFVSVRYPNVHVLANAGGKGLSGARNTGIRHASGDIVAFIDDDAVADSDWLEQLLATYEDRDVIAAGGLIEPLWPQERPDWFPREFEWVIGCSYLGLPRERASVRNLIGCNMSIRRDVFNVVGGFREALGRDDNNAYGCEETELFIRALDAYPQGSIQYEPAARVRHNIEAERTAFPYFRRRCLAEGISKAEMVRTVGTQQGLSSERSYTLKVLPKGVLRGLADTLKGDVSGLRRSLAIIYGFALVAGAYAGSKMKRTMVRPAEKAQAKPIAVLDVDVTSNSASSDTLDAVLDDTAGGVHCLVRSFGRPVDLVQLDFCENADKGAELKEALANVQVDGVDAEERKRTDAERRHVSVIVATRDRTDSLARCLDSLLQQSHQKMDIVVVDNAPSSSATEELLSETYLADGRVRYVREDRPGLARAHNTGLLYARGDILAFTDDDVVVDRHWVEAIEETFDVAGKVGCVTGLILPAELETRAQQLIEAHGGFGKGFQRQVFDLVENHPGSPLFPYAAGVFGSGANMAFSREALTKIGGFDNALGAGTPARGGDDLASFVSVVNAGFQLVYQPAAILRHYHRRTESGIEGQAYGYGVGLGAYLTKQIIDQPAVALTFARRVPAAFTHLFSNRSEKQQRLPVDFPRRLIWKERLGILMGVPGYLRSRFLRKDEHQTPTSPSRLVHKPNS